MKRSNLLILVLILLIVVVLYLISNSGKELWVENNPIIKSGSTCVGPGKAANAEELVNDCCENANIGKDLDPDVKVFQIEACKKCLGQNQEKWLEGTEAKFTGNGVCFRNNQPVLWDKL